MASRVGPDDTADPDDTAEPDDRADPDDTERTEVHGLARGGFGFGGLG